MKGFGSAARRRAPWFCGAVLLVGVALSMNTEGVAAAPPAELPSDSIYRLDLNLLDQNGRPTKLVDHRGTPVLIAMFYTSCKFMCPLIIETIKRTEHALGDGARDRLRVVLVSFDAKRDTPQSLKAVANDHHVDSTRWTLARTDAADVRRLAAVLGVQYRQLANGDFNHSGVITLLDRNGRIKARSDRLGEVDGELVEATRAELAASP